ncbi:DUF4238 domain-containing protein [Desulfovibrio gilichinskyi]|uniref:DUF4238 domain-containing protein n=1 Tax=Desulfovibrio gilichinskyi TaxID=1519643 RepID=A0A1X7E0F7_9BACT|nr:DUF4238 domain-containing protein [Desulfovibrio gilichinskyi]SMF25059.1 Protein of unknown function [Desulfovibrio gilichinskyi]
MANPPLSHYSPKFANKAWADDGKYISYYRHSYANQIKKCPKGWKQWGRKRGLWSWDVENSLNKDLETTANLVYKKICSYNELTDDERILWSQFLLSQLVRTPAFIRYENTSKKLFGITKKPKRDRVGCTQCMDIKFLANRDWCMLLAHEDDFFVRSDNPVFMTGFIELPNTCLFYPLTPMLCFVACSMPKNWNAFTNKPNKTTDYQLEKDAAHFFNYHFAKASDESLILSPHHDRTTAEEMYKEVLGVYPQPPFPLHILEGRNPEMAFESIRKIMSRTDGCEYPCWQPMELEPFY